MPNHPDHVKLKLALEAINSDFMEFKRDLLGAIHGYESSKGEDINSYRVDNIRQIKTMLELNKSDHSKVVFKTSESLALNIVKYITDSHQYYAPYFGKNELRSAIYLVIDHYFPGFVTTFYYGKNLLENNINKIETLFNHGITLLELVNELEAAQLETIEQTTKLQSALNNFTASLNEDVDVMQVESDNFEAANTKIKNVHEFIVTLKEHLAAEQTKSKAYAKKIQSLDLEIKMLCTSLKRRNVYIEELQLELNAEIHKNHYLNETIQSTRPPGPSSSQGSIAVHGMFSNATSPATLNEYSRSNVRSITSFRGTIF